VAREAITRDNTVEKFLKAYGAAEVSEKAKEDFVLRFDLLAETIAQKAITAARTDAPDRPRVEPSHLAKAFEGLGWSTAGDLDPAALLARLHQMPPEQIAILVRLVREWLAAHATTR